MGGRNKYFLEHDGATKKNSRNKDGGFAGCLYLCALSVRF